MGAKGLLIIFSLLIGLFSQYFIPTFREYPLWFWVGLFWAITQSLNPFWYYQGLGQMKFVAGLDIVTKSLATLAVFVFIHSPDQAMLFLVLQGIASFISTFIGLLLAYKRVPFKIPNFRLTLNTLKLGWSMFLFRSAVSFYTVGNTFILGFFTTPEYVGYYAGAEKISKALLGLIVPFCQAIYPQLSYVVQNSKIKAAKMAQSFLKIMALGGLLIGLIAFSFASLFVKVLLGENFQPAITTLQILSLLPPLIALNNFFGMQWMLPLGLDKPFNWIIIFGGIINIGFAIVLASKYAQNGMAVAVVISETFVTVAMYSFLKIAKLDLKTFLRRQSDVK